MSQPPAEPLAERLFAELTDAQKELVVRAVSRKLLADSAQYSVSRKDELTRVTSEVTNKQRIFPAVMTRVRKELRDKLGLDVVEVALKRASKKHAPDARGAGQTQMQILSQFEEAAQNQLGSLARVMFFLSNLLDPAGRQLLFDKHDQRILGLLGCISWVLLMQPNASLTETALWNQLERIGIRRNDAGELVDHVLVPGMYLERIKELETVTYLIGPRTLVELGAEGIIDLIQDVYGADLDEAFKSELRVKVALI